MREWIVYDENYWWRTYYFPVIVEPEEGFDFRRIYPIKQKNVRKAIDLVKQMPWIKELWIFGSAACNRCRWESDLDLAILYDEEVFAQSGLNDPSGDLYTVDDNGVDLLKLNKLQPNEDVYYEIKKRGVCYVNSSYNKST